MEVLLSIKPEFANKIFDGEKKFEYRKAIFKRADVNKVIVYASAPISKVIGEFEIGDIITDEISSLWDKTKDHSGITEDFFFEYFDGREIGHAIAVKNCVKYSVPYCIKTTFGIKPPQSFTYV